MRQVTPAVCVALSSPMACLSLSALDAIASRPSFHYRIPRRYLPYQAPRSFRFHNASRLPFPSSNVQRSGSPRLSERNPLVFFGSKCNPSLGLLPPFPPRRRRGSCIPCPRTPSGPAMFPQSDPSSSWHLHQSLLSLASEARLARRDNTTLPTFGPLLAPI